MPTATFKSLSSGMVDHQGDEGPRGPNQAASFPKFALLPREIRVHILELACQLPKSTITADSTSLSTCFDTSTTLNLAVVSVECHAVAVATLYRHVRLTRVSSLRRFHHALTTRAKQLPQLVKSLHIGPEEELPDGTWPIVYDDEDNEDDMEDPDLYILTSLSEGEEHLRPIWCQPQHSFGLKSAQTCAEWSIARAVRAARLSIDVDLHRKQRDTKGSNIGLYQWSRRIFDVQAALDLYLIQMRRVDEKMVQSVAELPAAHADCPRARCAHYPKLVVLMDPNAVIDEDPVTQGPATFSVTRADMDSHLYRPGATTDLLDHPLILARSGRKGLAFPNRQSEISIIPLLCGPIKPPDVVAGTLLGTEGPPESDPDSVIPFSSLSLSDDESDDDDNESDQDDDEKEEDLGRRNDPHSLHNDTGTFAEVLSLSRSILSSMTQVSMLSLSSHYHHLLCGSESIVPRMEALRFLSIGPSNPLWDQIFDARYGRLANVEQLRISGATLSELEAACISKPSPQGFNSLRLVQWILMGFPFADRIRDLLLRLQGRAPRDNAKRSLNIADPVLPVDASAGSLLVELHLMPAAAQDVLKLAPSDEHRAAWRQGDLAPGAQNRIRIVDCKAKIRGIEETEEGFEIRLPRWGSIILDVGFYHTEARKWWEERAMNEGR